MAVFFFASPKISASQSFHRLQLHNLCNRILFMMLLPKRGKCSTRISTDLVIFSLIRCLFVALFECIQPATAPPDFYNIYLYFTFVSTPVQPTTVGINSFKLVNSNAFILLTSYWHRTPIILSMKYCSKREQRLNNNILFMSKYDLHICKTPRTHTHLFAKCASHFQRQIIWVAVMSKNVHYHGLNDDYYH